MARGITSAMQTEAFRIPYVVAPNTWLWSALITVAAAAASALAVRHRLHRYDLVQVLKTRE
jgi:putative ABC transport system permease protein